MMAKYARNTRLCIAKQLVMQNNSRDRVMCLPFPWIPGNGTEFSTDRRGVHACVHVASQRSSSLIRLHRKSVAYLNRKSEIAHRNLAEI